MTLVADSSTEPAVVEETHRNRNAWWITTALIAAAALIVTGIWLLVRDGESTTDEPTTAGAAPFHAIPSDSVVVSGTAACSFSDDGVDPEGGAGMLVVCELDMSDPRVSGTETHDRFRFFDRPGPGTLWLAEDAVIANTEGTWRGSAQAAENNAAIPSGEAHYVGEGGYEGLEFHYYFFHADLGDEAELRGWISGGG